MIPCVLTPPLPPGTRWAVTVVRAGDAHHVVLCIGCQYFTIAGTDPSDPAHCEFIAKMLREAIERLLGTDVHARDGDLL